MKKRINYYKNTAIGFIILTLSTLCWLDIFPELFIITYLSLIGSGFYAASYYDALDDLDVIVDNEMYERMY